MTNKISISYPTIALLSLGLSIIIHLHIVISILSGRLTEVGTIIPEEVYALSLPLDEFIKMAVGISTLCTFIFTFLLYVINFKILNMPVSKKGRAALIVAATFLLPLASTLLFMIALSLWSGAEFHLLFFDEFLGHSIGVAVVVDVSVFFIHTSKRKQQMVVNYEMLRTENAKTKYEVLRNQIDPHFLFNSLNTLVSLIDIDTAKAKDYVRQLSHVFRYSLQNNDVITLSEEIHFTKSYCELMRIRYGSSLTFVFKIAEEHLKDLIIPLSIQILVENAVKHNIINKKQPLTIRISTSENPAQITVSNPVQRRKEEMEGEGIGLPNLVERYRLKWQKEVIIRESENEFSVIIPLIDYESNNN